MSTIDELETIFVEAFLDNLLEDVVLEKNYIKVYVAQGK